MNEQSYCQVPSIYTTLNKKYGNFMRTDAVAKELGCHAAHVRKMCQNGDLPGVQVGNRWFIPTAKFAALLDGEADEV